MPRKEPCPHFVSAYNAEYPHQAHSRATAMDVTPSILPASTTASSGEAVVGGFDQYPVWDSVFIEMLLHEDKEREYIRALVTESKDD
jgi:hypothetical protein